MTWYLLLMLTIAPSPMPPTAPSAASRTGGFAAANIALHHPDVFSTVLSLGGYFVADNSPVFGVGAVAGAYRRINSPAMYATTPSGLQAARSLTIFLGVGT